MDITRFSLDEWDDALPDDGFEVFHQPAALSVLDDHASGDLRLYAGVKGETPVALFPVFVDNRSVGTTVLSPPPGFAVPRLGPLVMSRSPKRRKQEKVNNEFAEGVLDDVGADGSLTLFRAVCPTAYPDPRPYVWSDFSLDTSFTYRLSVTESPDDILKSFSKSLRREIRDGEDLDVTVSYGDEDATKTVFEQTRDRYAEQDRVFGPTWPYVRDLTQSLADENRCRTYVVRSPDGDVLSGVIVLYSNDAAHYWLGGTRTTYDGTSVNSLLHWRIIQDIADDDPVESVTEYDLMGANTERLCQYKSKFGAALAPYYTLESAGLGMQVAKTAYQFLEQ